MWKQVITPTLLVAGCWIVGSFSTTGFIYWLDQSHQRAFTASLNSTNAASEVRESTWRHLSYFNSGEPGVDSLPITTRQVEKAIAELGRVTTTAEGTTLVNQLRSQWQEFLELLNANHGTANLDSAKHANDLHTAAERIALTAKAIRQANDKLRKSSQETRDRWKVITYTTRFTILIIGPMAGIALGWWISRRMHQSISQINIILKGADAELDQNLAKLRLSGREDLADLRERVQKFVERMMQVNSELETARRETLRTERLAAVGELAAGVAHELRNPLTSVKLLLQNAAQKPGQTSLTDEESCVVLDEIVRMENTIQALLDFSRPPSPHRQRHDLRETLQRGLNLVHGRAKQQQVQIEASVSDRSLIVDGDPEQLHQVFVNLLINGIEAHAGGVLQVQAEQSSPGETIRVRLRDHGPGIPEHVLLHLFEPFVSTKLGGTGLGLAISRRIVSLHGGSLTAENHPDGGAVITLELPAIGHNAVSPDVPHQTPVSAGP